MSSQQGFGKRGRVDVAGARPPVEPPKSDEGGGIPTWAIGAVAAVALFALVASSGVGGGGFFSGLLGGMLASKMINQANTTTAANSPANAGSCPGGQRQTSDGRCESTRSRVPVIIPYSGPTSNTSAATSPAARADVSRGGFGGTASASGSGSSWSFGG